MTDQSESERDYALARALIGKAETNEAFADDADPHALRDAVKRLHGRLAEVERLRETLAEARLYGEKMLRDSDTDIRRCGADLLQIIDRPSDEGHDLRAALRRAHDMLDKEHGHSVETWADRERERARLAPDERQP